MKITAQQKAAFAAEHKAINDERDEALRDVDANASEAANLMAQMLDCVAEANAALSRMQVEWAEAKASAADTWRDKMQGLEGRLIAAATAGVKVR